VYLSVGHSDRIEVGKLEITLADGHFVVGSLDIAAAFRAAAAEYERRAEQGDDAEGVPDAAPHG
jgi:hypothetical protein